MFYKATASAVAFLVHIAAFQIQNGAASVMG